MLSSQAFNEMKEREWNYDKHFRDQFDKIDKVLRKCCTRTYLPDEEVAQLEENAIQAVLYNKHKSYLKNAEKMERLRKCQLDQAKSSGGDADRSVHSYFIGDSGRRNHGSPSASHHVHSTCKMKVQPKSSSGKDKYLQSFTPKEPNLPECIGDHHMCLSDAHSNTGDYCNRSDNSSCKSQKSSKTVVSIRSSHDLRKLVESKCKMHEEVEKAIENLVNDDADKSQKYFHMPHEKNNIQLETLPTSHCKHCTDKNHPLQLSRRDVTTEIGKLDFAEGQNLDTLTISVDDVVNSKVINPMIRKLQRMYLNNLKEEMSLMEDLERLPHKVNEVYKATIFKNRDKSLAE